MASPDSMTRYGIKPAAVASISATAAALYRPGAHVLIAGQAWPLPVLVGAATFAASELVELVNSYLFEHIPVISILSAPMHTGLSIGMLTGVVAGVENQFSPGLVGDLGLPEIAAFAAASEIGGTYLTNQWLSPWMQQMME